MNIDRNEEELLAAYIDGELSDPAEIAQVEAMIASNATMQREVSLLSAMRSQLRNRKDSLRTQIPVDLERAIRLKLGEEVVKASSVAPEKISFRLRLASFLARPLYAIPAALVLAVAITGLVMVMNRSGKSVTTATASAGTTAAFEMTSAAYSNFQAVVRGELKLARQSSDTTELRKFFQDEGVTYSVFFPEVAAELKGGVVSVHGKKRYAHLVYATGKHLVYLLEVDVPSLSSGAVALSSHVAQDVRNSKWHWQERDGIGTLFVWKSNTVMCSAVSDLSTQDFSALFRLETL
ncbi:MAG: hypothetical protein H7X70_05980 [Candidatus Kapabacteria bacterium]|nr:hypothetical protein [Candidatus Kapabacteria bacterium]